MPLVFTVVGVSAAGFALFWGLTLFLQRFWYNEPADKLPLRAAVGGLALGCFFGFWVYVNTRADGENKYGVIHQFSPNDKSAPVAKFQAVRKYPNAKREETVAFERQPVGGGQKYRSADGKDFALNTPDYLTVGLIVEDAGKPVRYDAVLQNDAYVGEHYQFKDKDGGRTVEWSRPFDASEPLSVVSPSGGAVFLALLLNVVHLVIWFAIFWPVLKFNVGHAMLLAVIFFAMSTVLLMPLLFEANKVPKAAVAVTTPATTK